MPKRFSGVWCVPFIGAAVAAVLFFRFGQVFGMGGWQRALTGAVAGFAGSCILLLFEWLECVSEAARQQKEGQAAAERAMLEGFPEQPPTSGSSLFGVLMAVLALVTFWIPLLGFLIACYAVYRAGRDDLPAWIGCSTVCLLLISIAVSFVGMLFLVFGE